MRHRKAGRKLNRNSSHRKAMFRNMVTSLFKYDRIQTTDAKAKELRILADRMVTLAKRGDLHARRQALAIIREKDVVHKLFDEAKERFGNTAGGYTRIIKIGNRPGDAAPVSFIELIAPEAGKKKTTKKTPPPKVKAEKAVEAKKPASEKPAPTEKPEAPTESTTVEEKAAEPAATEKEDASDHAEDTPDESDTEKEETGDALTSPEPVEEKSKESSDK